MNFIFTGKNMEISDSLKERLKKKLHKFEKFFNENAEVHATFKKEKNKHILEITIPYNGTTYRAEEKNDDMFTSIDKIVDTLDGQIKKNKTKFTKKAKAVKAKVVRSAEESEVKGNGKKIIEVSKYSVKPMTVKEAMMQINLEDSEFFMFFNSETKQVNMIYRMENGSFGLAEPEE